MNDPWAKLVAEAAGGSQDAFAQLYRAFWPKVLTICRHNSNNEEDARDATQLTFVNLHRYLPNFRGQSLFSTWLHRIAKNESLQIVRKNKSRPTIQMPDNLDLGYEKPDRLPLLQALDNLTPHQRNVLRLHLAYGYNHAEMAEMLGVSITATKSAMHQCHVKITTALKGSYASKKEKRLSEAKASKQDKEALVKVPQDDTQVHQDCVTA